MVDFGETGNIGQTFSLTRIGESTLVRFGFNVDASRGNVVLTSRSSPDFSQAAAWDTSAMSRFLRRSLRTRVGNPPIAIPSTMSEEFKPTPHTFVNKFRFAFRGIAVGGRSQSSFVVHLVAATLVIGFGAWLQSNSGRMVPTRVMHCDCRALELINSSIESLARAIDRQHNENLRDALDIASGAVLVGAIGTAVVGVMILLPRLWRIFG